MPKCQNLVESNDVGTYLHGWGMSIATQRAKERENQTPGVKVMAETKFQRSLFLHVTDVHKRTDVRGPDVQAGTEVRKFGTG